MCVCSGEGITKNLGVISTGGTNRKVGVKATHDGEVEEERALVGVCGGGGLPESIGISSSSLRSEARGEVAAENVVLETQ